jgi:hypothetical protein
MSSKYSHATLKLKLIHTLNIKFVHTFINSQFYREAMNKNLYTDELATENPLLFIESLVKTNREIYELITNRLGNIIDLIISLAYISDTEIENLLQDPTLLIPIFGDEENKYNLIKKANVDVD